MRQACSRRTLCFDCDGLNPLVYTSPVYDGNVVLAMGGYFGASLAVKPGGNGDVTAKRLWHEARAKKKRQALAKKLKAENAAKKAKANAE